MSSQKNLCILGTCRLVNFIYFFFFRVKPTRWLAFNFKFQSSPGFELLKRIKLKAGVGSIGWRRGETERVRD